MNRDKNIWNKQGKTLQSLIVHIFLFTNTELKNHADIRLFYEIFPRKEFWDIKCQIKLDASS